MAYDWKTVIESNFSVYPTENLTDLTPMENRLLWYIMGMKSQFEDERTHYNSTISFLNARIHSLQENRELGSVFIRYAREIAQTEIGSKYEKRIDEILKDNKKLLKTIAKLENTNIIHIGNKNKLPKRPSNEYNIFVKRVLSRDAHTCQRCGSSKNLEVHHIFNWANYQFLGLHSENGITLCSDCHHEFHKIHGHTSTPIKVCLFLKGAPYKQSNLDMNFGLIESLEELNNDD